MYFEYFYKPFKVLINRVLTFNLNNLKLLLLFYTATFLIIYVYNKLDTWQL